MGENALMIAMRYDVVLPADYDMRIIHTRVATRGHALDELPGLELKAYCVQERGVVGATVNRYAPFYLWRESRAMTGFLGGAGFRGLCNSFGRPRVDHWSVDTYVSGAARITKPAWASVETHAIDADVDLEAALAAAREESRVRASRSDLHSSALGLDPLHWRLVQFALWNEFPEHVAPAARYRVLHVSIPGAAAKPA